MDPLALWGRLDERQDEAAHQAMIRRRQTFNRLVAAEKKKPSQRRLLQLWRAASNDPSR